MRISPIARCFRFTSMLFQGEMEGSFLLTIVFAKTQASDGKSVQHGVASSVLKWQSFGMSDSTIASNMAFNHRSSVQASYIVAVITSLRSRIATRSLSHQTSIDNSTPLLANVSSSAAQIGQTEQQSGILGSISCRVASAPRTTPFTLCKSSW
jgi:hypothetical protein